MSKTPALLAGALVLLTLVACGGPERPGPNVQKVPAGFMYDANAYQGRKVFRDVEPLDESGWFAMRGEDHSSIMITTYTGVFDSGEIRAARDAHARQWGRKSRAVGGTDYGDVEEVEIDGHTAWAWESRQYFDGALASVEWTAVIPYQDIEQTYAVQFHAGIEDHMDPGLIRETVQSFRAP